MPRDEETKGPLYGSGWERVDVAPGVTVYRRKDMSRTTYTKDAPWIHRHFLATDDEAAKAGEGIAELCCHHCGRAAFVRYLFPAAGVAIPSEGLSPLRRFAESFDDLHRSCAGGLRIAGMFLCPPADRTSTITVDLRAQCRQAIEELARG